MAGAEMTALPSTASLEALQGTDQRQIMDLVDRLRRAGLSSILKLPQVVVCGDQSSGKSSVLEAITEIPFPRKENLCTRFATEIIMRRDINSSVSCKIIPDKSRPEEEQKQLAEFYKRIENFAEVPALIEEATVLMGLNSIDNVVRAFSRDVLSIEICGPNRPQLTLVDLPGLIHAENKSQTKQDVQLIRSLVEEYISNDRTIILAVITAKNDYANQIILERAREVDPRGSRTLGIITKPDFLKEGSENQQSWLDLASNKDIFFELGWHMLRNRKDEEKDLTFAERNANETLFFSSGRYRELPKDRMGIEHLCAKLSTLLFGHLKKELPALRKELDAIAEKTGKELSLMGDKRSSLEDRKDYLMNVFTEARELLGSGVQGQYTHEFFHELDIDGPVLSDKNARRLRAVIQDLNIKFSQGMQKKGQKFSFPKSPSQTKIDAEDDPVSVGVNGGHLEDMDQPISLSRDEAIQWATQTVRKSRGLELPGVFNHYVIGQLFWEQSSKWEKFARAHVDCIADVCQSFAHQILNNVAAPEVKTRLFAHTVDSALKDAHKAASMELSFIIEDMKRQPITYNHYFTDTLQKIQRDKFNYEINQVVAGAQEEVNTRHGGTQLWINRSTLSKGINARLEQDMDKFSADQALDTQTAYYKDERKYFVNAITKQVIERHLISNLPKLLLPKMVAHLSTEDLDYLAAEPEELAARRLHLESQMQMLEVGQQAFRKTMRG